MAKAGKQSVLDRHSIYQHAPDVCRNMHVTRATCVYTHVCVTAQHLQRITPYTSHVRILYCICPRAYVCHVQRVAASRDMARRKAAAPRPRRRDSPCSLPRRDRRRRQQLPLLLLSPGEALGATRSAPPSPKPPAPDREASRSRAATVSNTLCDDT